MKRRAQSESNIYLDNAATTALDPTVWEAMQPYWQSEYGNPSTTYAKGAKAKVAIEEARRTIQHLIGAHNGNIFFTSGGTESNNWAIRGIIEKQNIRHIITSPIEHKSILDSVQITAAQKNCQVHYVKLTHQGHIDYQDLARQLSQYPKALVSLMHGNNEIGTISDIQQIGTLCHQNNALFHTDMVQTMGYEPINLATMPVDLATASAHKFHGPKGSGLLYIRNDIAIAPLIYGGTQEKSLRGGTENVAGVVGMAQALSIAVNNQIQHKKHLYNLKKHLVQQLQNHIKGITLYGYSPKQQASLCSIISLGLPQPYNSETVLLHLDIEGIAASAGSACMSGTTKQSHVLAVLKVPINKAVVRLSLSKYNTLAEIEKTVASLVKIRQNNKHP